MGEKPATYSRESSFLFYCTRLFQSRGRKKSPERVSIYMCTLQKGRKRSQQSVGMDQRRQQRGIAITTVTSIIVIIFFFDTLVQAQAAQQRIPFVYDLSKCTRCITSSKTFCGVYYGFSGKGTMTSYINNMRCSLVIDAFHRWTDVDGITISVTMAMEPSPDTDYVLVQTCYQDAQGYIVCAEQYRVQHTNDNANANIATEDTHKISLPNPLPPGFYIDVSVISDSTYDSLCSDETSCNRFKETNVPELKYVGANASFVHTCKPGYSQQKSGCVMCEPGRYSYVSGTVGTCPACPTSMYQPSSGQTSCIFCDRGSTTILTGSTSCTLCPRGSYGVANTRECKKCDEGKYNPNEGSTSEISCLPCPRGTYSSLEGRPECTPCDQGTYSDTTGTRSCTKCPKGKYNQIQGAKDPDTDCQPCALGSISDLYGTICYPCGIGTYQDMPETTCKWCSPGSYADAPMAVNCSICPAGSFSGREGTYCFFTHFAF